MARKPSLVSDILAIKMGTLGYIEKYLRLIEIQGTIDYKDDLRRENHYKFLDEFINELTEIANEIKHKDLISLKNSFVKHINKNKAEEFFYEEQDDELRKLTEDHYIEDSKRLGNENYELELNLMNRNYSF